MKLIKRFGIAVFTVLTITSCSDSFFDVNTDVNSPTFSTPELSLPAAQKLSGDLLEGGYNSMNTLGNLWSYSWAAAGDFAYFEEETSYRVTSSFRPTTFTTAYLGPLANFDYIEKNTDPKNDNYRAIAKIMKAFHFQYLVDAYGDIPYTEAFQRANNPTPKYDAAQDIYNDLIVQLTAAQAIIANPSINAVAVGTNDIMCGGDMAKWAKFANTLKLRILLRQSEIGVSDYSSVNNGIGFLGAGETVFCNPGYIALVVTKQNPFYDAFKLDASGNASANSNATRATSFALSRFDNADARKPLYWIRFTTGLPYRSIEQNGIGGAPSTSLSGIGNGIFKSADMPNIVMHSAESLFLQAEATERGFITGNAQALYEAGVQESYNQVGAGSASTELVGAYAYSGNSAQKISQIFQQKFIALMSTNGFENWIESRRLNAAIPIAVNGNTGNPIGPSVPVRLFYPTSEYANNAANVPNLISGDEYTKKVFWDN